MKVLFLLMTHIPPKCVGNVQHSLYFEDINQSQRNMSILLFIVINNPCHVRLKCKVCGSYWVHSPPSAH